MKIHEKIMINKETKTRMVGIDILRLLSMFGVVVLHVIGKGGILDSSKDIISIQMVICYGMELLFMQAVNCYALISGYVAYCPTYGGTLRIDKYLLMWLQVAFYSVLIPTGAYAVQKATLSEILCGFLPVSMNIYWYFSAYTGLFFLRPYLNKLVEVLSEQDIKKFAIVLFAVFAVGGGIVGRNTDPMGLRNGYSVLWLVLLYVLGACMRKEKLEQRIRTKWLIIVGCVSYGLNFFSVVAIPVIVKRCFHISIPRGILWSYLSPTIILMAVCTLLLFAKLNVFVGSVSRWFSKLAVSAFGVYLIHSNPVFSRIFLENKFVLVGQQPIWIMIPTIILIAVIVFVFCLIVEIARITLFRFLKVERSTKALVQHLRIERD